MPAGSQGNRGARISLKRKANFGLAWACVGFASIGAFMHAADKPVSFTADILPVFENSCWKCHGGAIQLSKLDLRTREGALKGGEKGAAIVPGKAEDSRLYRLVAGLEKPSMPLDGKLTASQVSLLKEWINQGAVWDAAPGDSTSGARQTQMPGSPQLSPLEEMPISPEARSYWAFQKPVRSAVPVVSSNLP